MTATCDRGIRMPSNETQPCKTARTTVTTGPRCRRCKASEAACAYRDGCCPACTHWRNYTPEGEPIDPRIAARQEEAAS